MSLRLGWFTALAIILFTLIWVLAPAQLPVLLLKLAIISLGGTLGYWLDRHLFPYARPHQFRDIGYQHEMLYAAAMLRRAIVVGAVTIALALAL